MSEICFYLIIKLQFSALTLKNNIGVVRPSDLVWQFADPAVRLNKGLTLD